MKTATESKSYTVLDDTNDSPNTIKVLEIKTKEFSPFIKIFPERLRELTLDESLAKVPLVHFAYLLNCFAKSRQLPFRFSGRQLSQSTGTSRACAAKTLQVLQRVGILKKPVGFTKVNPTFWLNPQVASMVSGPKRQKAIRRFKSLRTEDTYALLQKEG